MRFPPGLSLRLGVFPGLLFLPATLVVISSTISCENNKDECWVSSCDPGFYFGDEFWQERQQRVMGVPCLYWVGHEGISSFILQRLSRDVRCGPFNLPVYRYYYKKRVFWTQPQSCIRGPEPAVFLVFSCTQVRMCLSRLLLLVGSTYVSVSPLSRCLSGEFKHAVP